MKFREYLLLFVIWVVAAFGGASCASRHQLRYCTYLVGEHTTTVDKIYDPENNQWYVQARVQCTDGWIVITYIPEENAR